MRLLGLQDHPASRAVDSHRRHKVHMPIVYHADSWTKYKMQPPQLQMRLSDANELGSFLTADDATQFIKRSTLLSHLQTCFKSDGTFYSIPLEDNTIRTLHSVLQAKAWRSE